MSQTKNKFLALLIILFLFMAFSCNKNKKDPGAGLDTAPERTLLNILAGQSTSDPGIEEIISAAVKEKIPEDELFWERMDWGDQFNAQMRIRFAAGEIPDIMIGKAQDIANYAPSGYIAEISPALAKYIRPDITPSVSHSGKIYGIPLNSFYQGVLYNKDIFERYGLRPPQTLDDLTAIIETLSSAGIIPFATHFEEPWNTANVVMQLLLGEIFSEQSSWGDSFRKGETSFSDSAAILNCFLELRKIIQNSWDDAISVNLFESDQRFAESEAAMYVSGTWSLQNIEALNPRIKLGIFPYPNSKGKSRLIIEPNLTFMKSSVSPYSEKIDEVLKVILEDEDLLIRIANYTKTSLTIKNLDPCYPMLIQDDILRYEQSNMIIDATLGNSQLVWSFQEKLAEKILEWMKNLISLDDVLAYADKMRTISSPSE